MTFLPRVASKDRLNAYLSFLTVTRSDYHRGVYLPQPIAPADEIPLIKTFFGFIEIYEKLDSWHTLFSSLLEAAHGIINNAPADNINFLKDRFNKICPRQSRHPFYWKTFAHTPYPRLADEYAPASLSIAALKEIADFSLLVVFLALWYGRGDLMQKTIGRTMQRFTKKYRNAEVLSTVAIFLLSIDFAFIRDKGLQCKNSKELAAIARMLKEVNPSTQVQPLHGTCAWARDLFSWLDIDFRLLLQGQTAHRSKGGLQEGGNIVAGSAKTKFILLSREATSAESAVAKFLLEVKNLGIEVYALPGGFTRARNAATGQDTLLDSTHIDTVINVIPARHTADNRTKIIVDPYYHDMIKDDEEFRRLQKEQEIDGDGIVIIDKSEAYLNLANFSIIIGRSGSQKIIFNKDRGMTLPRVCLKKKDVLQPGIEITGISAFNGGLRCITNMCPQSQIKRGSSLIVTVDRSVPEKTEAAIAKLFAGNKLLLNTLAQTWVASLQIRDCLRKSTYEFDYLTRSLSINLKKDTPRKACIFIEKSIARASFEIRKKMGIYSSKNLPDNPFDVISPIPGYPETGFFIRRRTGQLTALHSPADAPIVKQR